MHFSSHVKSKQHGGKRHTAACFLLGILLVCSLSAGCSSRARPLSLAFGGLQFAPDADGLAELLKQMPKMSADDKKAQLRSFADSTAPPAIRARAAYVLARELQESGSADDWREALTRYETAEALPALQQRCRLHRCECATKLGDEKLVRNILQEIIDQSDDKDSRVSALYSLGQSYMRTGEHENARQTLSRIFDMAPDSQFALGSTYYLAQLDLADAAAIAGGANGRETAGQPKPPKLMSSTTGSGSSEPEKIAVAMPFAAQAATSRAIAAFRHYLLESPDGRFAIDIVSQLQHLPEFHPTVADHNLFARVYFANGDYKDALSEWKKAGNNAEWFKQGTALLRLGRTAEGKNMLAAGIKNHPSDEAVPTAATTLCRFANRDGAIAIWKGVLQHSPKFADIASYNLAIRASSPAAALPYYKHIMASYPTSAYAPESAWWVGWNQIAAGDAHGALATLQVAANRYPQAKAQPRFLYWIGKMYERLGQREAAKNAYARAQANAPWHYYAHRASARLAALNGASDPGWSTNPNRHPAWSADTAEEWQFPEPPMQLAHDEGPAVEILTELKQWDECLELLKEKTGILRAFYLAKLDMPLEAINAAGKALHGQPQGNEAWQLSYPLLYAHFIAREAPAKHVDPFLVQALIREESRYNAQAISSSHALGLMQLMPGTAWGVAKRLGITLHNNADILNPETNMRLGIDYLSYVLRRFNGNALFAVASYNGGPNAVQRWSARMPADTDVFVENIPFTETRDYVRKVFGSYWNYQLVYSNPEKPQ